MTYDLSRRIETGMPVYPDDPEVDLSPHATVEADGYRVTTVRMGTHAGTHIDAPAHVVPGGRSIDEYDPANFRFEAVKLDVTEKAPRDPITRNDIRAAAASVSPDDTFAADMFVLQTGWDEHWGTDWYRNHPYLLPDAAEWLADQDYHVGVDALSVDPSPGTNVRPDEPEGMPAHRAVLGGGQFIVENLTNLGALPSRFTLHAYPIRIADGDGAPVRAFAVTDE